MFFAHPYYLVAMWLFIVALSFFTALMEIQIEGGNGWAGCLPSWRFAPGWFRFFLNGKELTGYHVYLNLHLLVLFHLPVLLTGFSWMTELSIGTIFFGSMICEDLLWFVLNPHFGWNRYKPENISWFPSWVGGFPTDYYLWLGMSASCAALRGAVPGAVGEASLGTLPLAVQQLVGWGLGFGLAATIVGVTIRIVTPGITRFLSQDTLPHPGHPGICVSCAKSMPEHVVKVFTK